MLPESVVEEDPHWTIAVNRNQNLIGRLIVVLRRPLESVTLLSAAEWSELHWHIRRTRAALDQLLRPDQYNYAFLMNADVQVHLHVIPRYRRPREWNGDTFIDPDFGELFGREQRMLDPQRLSLLASRLAGYLSQ
jgi:diadenosine tetraphosphate (Ap4A) HIT family hydrolase